MSNTEIREISEQIELIRDLMDKMETYLDELEELLELVTSNEYIDWKFFMCIWEDLYNLCMYMYVYVIENKL